MADYLAGHEADYKDVFGDIQDKLNSLRAGTASPQDTARLGSAVEEGVEEALGILQRMSTEVQILPTAQRPQHNTAIRARRSELDKAKREARRLVDGAGRDQLFGSRQAGGRDRPRGSTDGDDQRQQLLSSQQRLEQSSDRLRDAQRIGNETEAIGAGILSDLRGQREQIEHSRTTLTEADSYVDKSLRTLRSMARRMAANRIISYAIIAVLIILIVFVLVSKFF